MYTQEFFNNLIEKNALAIEITYIIGYGVTEEKTEWVNIDSVDRDTLYYTVIENGNQYEESISFDKITNIVY